MMFFTVNIGNTNTAAGIYSEKKRSAARRLSNSLKTTEDFKELFTAAFAGCGDDKAKPEGSVLSSVVPQLTSPCIEALKGFTGKNPLVVSAQVSTAVDFSGYTSLLGSDRIAVCAAAFKRFGAPFIAIDMGTAATFNVVDQNGKFLGGAIVPGLLMGFNAQLPVLELMPPHGIIGHNMEECLLSGAFYGMASIADGLTERMTEALGRNVKVILTGGSAGAVLPYMKTKPIYEPDLILEGLAVLYRENRAPRSELAAHASRTRIDSI